MSATGPGTARRSPRRTVPDLEQVRQVVATACRAPSVHNTQPWTWVWRSREAVLELRADSGRQLMRVDPNGRDLVISCGAALHHAVVGARAAGVLPVVHRVPDHDDSTLLARIVLDQPHATTDADRVLLDAVAVRRTDRRPVAAWPVPAATLDVLVDEVVRHGVLAFGLPDEVARHVVVRATDPRATRHEWLHEHEDVLAWLADDGEQGIPRTNLPDGSGPDAALSRFPAGTLEGGEGDPVSHDAAWLLLATSSDDRLSRLRAGEALSALWLRTVRAGLRLVPFSRPMELRSMAAQLEERFLMSSANPQLLVRIGWPASPEPVPPTPRRDVDRVLRTT